MSDEPKLSIVEALLPPTVTVPISANPWKAPLLAPLPTWIVPPFKLTAPILFHQPAPAAFAPL